MLAQDAKRKAAAKRKRESKPARASKVAAAEEADDAAEAMGAKTVAWWSCTMARSAVWGDAFGGTSP